MNSSKYRLAPWLTVVVTAVLCRPWSASVGQETEREDRPRLRVIVETDAGGDPDDEQSLVRLLLYANEWDIEGIIANRDVAIDGENHNRERTGLAIVQQLVRAYGACLPKLSEHDPRYPTEQYLLARTVAGYADADDAERLIIEVVDREDPRPVWYLEWGSDRDSGIVNMKRVLDQIHADRSREEYAAFKEKLRIVGYDQYGDHTHDIEPPFPLWVNTFEPARDRLRWYHRFSALTATAGGFDVQRDLLQDHGPLGALYPLNTTHDQKEGDTMTFLYLVPTGMNDPDRPEWGSWAGRYGLHDDFRSTDGKLYYWANQTDLWQGNSNRDNTVLRWAAHLQNDFRARLNWCVRGASEANDPPRVVIEGRREREVSPGDRIALDARSSTDPDGDEFSFQWETYPEASGYAGPAVEIQDAQSPEAALIVPAGSEDQELHVILTVVDRGEPPLARYGRVVIQVGSAPK